MAFLRTRVLDGLETALSFNILSFLLKGLPGKVGAKGSKGQIVSILTRKLSEPQVQRFEEEMFILTTFYPRVIQGRMGNKDPLASQVFLYVSDGIVWEGHQHSAESHDL